MTFLIDNWMLVLVALVSGGALLWPAILQQTGGQSVATLEATQLVNRGATLLDVRNPDEFAAGHIAGARNIPVAQLGQRLSEVGKNKANPIVVVCARGPRASTASALLRKQGFTEVVVLRGGMGAWQSAGLPVAK